MGDEDIERVVRPMITFDAMSALVRFDEGTVTPATLPSIAHELMCTSEWDTTTGGGISGAVERQ